MENSNSENLIETLDRIELVLSHIKHVQENCYALGIKLIKLGEIELGRNLIANGQIHDNSKFRGIEFKHLFTGDDILNEAVSHHSSTNQHHPQYWGKIQKMPTLYIAEMVCDCTARSSEFGTNVREWIEQEATKIYDFTMDDEIGKQITYYLDLLLQKPFKKK
jgi:hypothetical protein